VLVARRLKTALGQARTTSQPPSASKGPGESPGPFELLLVEAAHAPENCLGPVLRFAPWLVVFVDAAEMGEAPGAVRWLSWEETAGLGGSTHTVSPAMLARYLIPTLNCQVAVLAIQAGDTTIGAPLTPSVAAAVDEVVRGLALLLGTAAG
jgi:hydrogenase 3 maturation protease